MSEQSLFPIYVSKKVLLRPAAGRTEISQLFYDILVALANVTPTPTWRPPNQRKPGWLTGSVTLGGSARFPWMPLTPSCFPTTLITLFGMQNFPMCFRRQDGHDSVFVLVMAELSGARLREVALGSLLPHCFLGERGDPGMMIDYSDQEGPLSAREL